MEAPPGVYWDNVRLLWEIAEKEYAEAADYWEKVLYNISEAREQL